MRALSIRQPWAELILRGHKIIEVRSRQTHLRERVFIYAGLNRIEPTEEVRIAQEYGIDVNGLPRGVLVGSVKIEGCMPLKEDDNQAACFEITATHGFYAWHLARPERAEELVKPKNQPADVLQPILRKGKHQTPMILDGRREGWEFLKGCGLAYPTLQAV
jgi:hypothetical protein